MSILAVVPLLAAGGSAAFLARKALVDSAAAGLETTTQSKAVALERWLTDKLSDTEVLAQSELMSGRPETVQHSIELARRQQDEFEAIVVSGKGTVAQDGSASPELLALVKAGARAAQLQGRSPDGQVRLLLVVPLRESLGWLGATINYTPILSELSEIRPTPASRTWLEQASGVETGAAQHENGALVCRRALPRFGQAVASSTDLSEVLSPLGPILIVLGAFTVLGMAMSLVAVMWLTSRLRRPILQLEHAARDVAAERFDRRLAVEGDDELGSLARSFNEMTDKLELARTTLAERFRTALDRAETADKKLAAQERDMARAARLAALGTLSAGLAHEIRTPLAALQVFIQSLEQAPSLDRAQREDLLLARRELERLARLVERFLDFARPTPPQLARVDLHALLDDALRLVEPKLSATIRVVQQRDPGLAEVSGDRDQLKQVVVNLLLNAVQAMPQGGTIRIATEPLRDSNGAVFAVRLLVSDTGVGIASENLDRIFDPFFTTKPDGTGLGLPISHAIVEKHGGRLAVESRVGLGTQFAVELPISGKGAGG
ncbi:MAG TPA: ATP-binding protein [Planctomycetota bacterium]|nr:ATP-binding protein [Planctomycetota bacterium]